MRKLPWWLDLDGKRRIQVLNWVIFNPVSLVFYFAPLIQQLDKSCVIPLSFVFALPVYFIQGFTMLDTPEKWTETFSFHSWDSSSSFTRRHPTTNNSENSMKNALEIFLLFLVRFIIKQNRFFLSHSSDFSVFSPREIKKSVLTMWKKNVILKFRDFLLCLKFVSLFPAP